MKLGLGLSLANRGGAGGLSLPIPASGLSLWLKADAGTTTVAQQYISEIVMSGAGSTFANGTYTRASGGHTSFQNQSNNSTINWTEGSNWVLEGLRNDEEENLGLYTLVIYEFNGIEFIDDMDYGDGIANLPSYSVITTLNGNTVVPAWADQSGNNRNVTQGGYYSPNTATFAGKSFLNFPSVTPLLNSGNPIWPTNGTIDYGSIIIVARFPSSYQASTTTLFHHGVLRIGRGNDQTYSNGLTATKDDDVSIFGNSNLSNNTNYLIGMTFNLDSLSLYLNGASNGSGANFENNSNNDFSIGDLYAEPFSMAEIVVYNRVLTTPERQQVETYLMEKYAICLDSTSSVLMTGWVAGPRTLTPIGYAPYGLETYTYGDEVVRYDGSAWIYENTGAGEIARSYSPVARPWLATWPAGFTAEKVCS